MTDSALQAQRNVFSLEPAATVQQQGCSSWRHALGRLLVTVLTVATVIVQVSGPAEALTPGEDTPTAPFRSVDLESETFSDVLVSVAEQRIIVHGSESFVLYDLATLEVVSTVHFDQDTWSVQLYGDSVFAFESDTRTIAQIRLSDGVIVRRWDTDVAAISVVAASASYVWYASRDPLIQHSALCRIALDGSGTECFADPDRHFKSLIRVDPSEQSFVTKRSGGWFARHDLVGTQVVPRSPLYGGAPYGELVETEPLEGDLFWAKLGGAHVSVSRSTLRPSAILHGGESNGNLSAEPLSSRYVAIEVERQSLRLHVYRAGDATPIALLGAGWEHGRRTESLAVTETEVVQLISTNGNDKLNVYAIPTPTMRETVAPQRGTTAAGVRSLTGLGLKDVALLELFAAQDRLVVGGGEELFIYRLSDLSLVAHHTDIDGLFQVAASGTSLFVLARSSAEVIEFRLSDGAILNQWPVPVLATTGLAVTAEAVWVSFELNDPSTKLGRLDRVSGQIEIVGVEGATGTVRALQGSGGSNDLAVVALERAVSIISLEDDPRILHSHNRTGRFAVGAHGAAFYRIVYGQVAVHGLDGEMYRTDDVGVGVHLDVLASDLSGSGFAIGTDRGSIMLYDGSSEPTNRIETWDSVHQLAVSATELAAVTGELGDLTVTVRSREWAAPNHELQITRLAHGTPLVDPGPIKVECRRQELHEVPYGSTRTFSIPPNSRYCSVRPWQVPDSSITAVWTNGGWEVQEPGDVRVDLSAASRVLIIDYLPSPLNDDNRFVDQAYLDFTGETPQHPIGRNIAQLLRTNEISEVDLIAYLMYEEAAYESTQAPVSRLYRAYFLRNPDLAGHQFWVGRNQEGQDLRSISQFFATSPEFEQRYGSVSDAEFVRLVYQNVMSRVPDDEGQSFWISTLADGLSRGEMMTLFSDTPEFRSRVDADVFVTYLAGVLERRELTTGEHSRRMEIYREQGPAAVVLDILNGQTYFDRFWFEGTSTESISNAMFSQLVNGEVTGSAEPLPMLGAGLAEQLLLDVD